MRKAKLYWSLQIGGWILYAIFMVFGASLVNENFTASLATPIIIEAGFLLAITHVYRLYSKQWEWLTLDVSKLLPRVLLLILVMALVVYFFRVLVSYFLGLYTPDLLTVGNVFGNATGNFIILLVWSSVYFAYHYFERYNQSLKYEAAMNEMRLNQLKSQLNPHFIFNALNSIRALVDEEPVKSKRAINHLSNILRSTLAADKKKLTSLGEELGTVKDYLAMESIRFEERLETSFEVEEETENVLVPPLMIQTLVENSIKHGISKLKKGGQVSIKTYLKNGSLKIEIGNSGYFRPSVKNSSGYGIKNTKQRLALIYGESATFDIHNINDDTVLTTIKIPT